MGFMSHIRHRSLTSCKTLTSCLVLGLALSGCGGTTPTKDVVTTPHNAYADIDAKAVLAQAQLSQSPQRDLLFLQAAQKLNYDQQYTWALDVLESIDPESLDNDRFIEYSLLYSDVALADDAYFLAQRILTDPQLNQQWQNLTTEQLIALHQRRADVFMILGEPNASVKERLQLDALLTESDARDNNQDLLWQTLMSMPVAELQYRQQQLSEPASIANAINANAPVTAPYAVQENDAEENSAQSATEPPEITQQALSRTQQQQLAGWYSLALLSKNNQADLEKQQLKIYDWVAQWPNHPASLRLPKDLQLLQQLIANQPRQVALLMPQQGRLGSAGRAVRDGFMAAYYQALDQGSQVPRIKVYDTSSGDIIDVYNQAVTEGADLIIGPLDKEKVTQLSQYDEMPVPTLATNYATDLDAELVMEPARALYQFGLSAEDEARQIAQRAWVEGHRHAMVLVPNDHWGQRNAEAFKTAWSQLGGDILEHDEFTGEGDYSNVIKSALQIDQSEERARQLRGILNRAIEFEPRRRHDIDMLFLAARPTEARQIKPTLAFHYASDLPVYATSQVYSGVNDPKSDRDLNGIKFSTLPWFFDEASPVRQSIIGSAKPNASFQRLYALGVDTYRLYPRLQQLEQSNYARLYGVTGSLSMDSQRRITREQTWAQITNGRAKPLPKLVTHM